MYSYIDIHTQIHRDRQKRRQRQRQRQKQRQRQRQRQRQKTKYLKTPKRTSGSRDFIETSHMVTGSRSLSSCCSILYACMYIHYVQTPTPTHPHITHIHTCIHTYIVLHIHTYIHTYIHTLALCVSARVDTRVQQLQAQRGGGGADIIQVFDDVTDRGN